jgi:hypothetical protein
MKQRSNLQLGQLKLQSTEELLEIDSPTLFRLHPVGMVGVGSRVSGMTGAKDGENQSSRTDWGIGALVT